MTELLPCPCCGARASKPPTTSEREHLAGLIDPGAFHPHRAQTDHVLVEQRRAGHIADRILAAGFRRGHGWIACSERQPYDETAPNDDEWPTTYLTFPHFRQVSFFDGGWRHYDNDKDAWTLCVPYVTHWMPLPPAPDATDKARCIKAAKS